MSEIKDKQKPENENWGRTLMLTPKEETIQEIILDFMDNNGEGGCPAFSPDFMLRNLKPTFQSQNLLVGPKTLERVLFKSTKVHFDDEVTGTVSRYPYKASVTYKFSPNDENSVVVASIGGEVIKKLEGTFNNVGLTARYFIPIKVSYSGIIDWELEITEIKTEDGIELNLDNFSESGLKVIDNRRVVASDWQRSEKLLRTSEK